MVGATSPTAGSRPAGRRSHRRRAPEVAGTRAPTRRAPFAAASRSSRSATRVRAAAPASRARPRVGWHRAQRPGPRRSPRLRALPSRRRSAAPRSAPRPWAVAPAPTVWSSSPSADHEVRLLVAQQARLRQSRLGQEHDPQRCIEASRADAPECVSWGRMAPSEGRTRIHWTWSLAGVTAGPRLRALVRATAVCTDDWVQPWGVVRVATADHVMGLAPPPPPPGGVGAGGPRNGGCPPPPPLR